MSAYAKDLGIGYEVKSYGEGILMIKNIGSQGRCLFFSVRHGEDGTEILTALRVNKKESQKVPRREIEIAQRRMKETR